MKPSFPLLTLAAVLWLASCDSGDHPHPHPHPHEGAGHADHSGGHAHGEGNGAHEGHADHGEGHEDHGEGHAAHGEGHAHHDDGHAGHGEEGHADHGEKGHADHGDDHAPHGDDHGHDHGDAGGSGEEKAERPDESVTLYQNGLELFMEYPAFVVGEESPLIAHFTDTRDPEQFHVVTKGRLTARLRYANGGEETFVAERLLRDGIFKPVVVPTRSGKAALALELQGEQISGTVEVQDVTVHPNVAAAVKASPEEAAGETPVSFLKEAQWKTQYATAVAEQRALQESVGANGELKAVAGQAVELSSPVAGRIPTNDRVPSLGQAVRSGELLARVMPTAVASDNNLASVELELSRARSELGLAERELARVTSLLAAKAVPAKRLDESRVARDIAAARLSAAERQRSLYRDAQSGGAVGGDQAAFELRAPIDGLVAFADVTPGAVVEPGKRLVSIVNTQRLWLEARLYESDAPRVGASSGASFTVAGFEREFTIGADNGRLVTVGAVVDAATRTIPVVFELWNPRGELKPGMFAKVRVYTGEAVRTLAVPESAIVDDSGKPTVFVMEGGESFFKRPVRLGIRSGGYVQVLEGVTEGERVVSRGAYEMKLSTATGAIPEHGHQH
jgi:cobalt-zinc-cadmium efflux system membrane fusion protein